jgi:hypothetical protein
MTQSSPSRVAVVRIPWRSDPADGSVIPSAAIFFPSTIPGSHMCFCSSVPWLTTYGPQISEWIANPGPVQPLYDCSSHMMFACGNRVCKRVCQSTRSTVGVCTQRLRCFCRTPTHTVHTNCAYTYTHTHTLSLSLSLSLFLRKLVRCRTCMAGCVHVEDGVMLREEQETDARRGSSRRNRRSLRGWSWRGSHWHRRIPSIPARSAHPFPIARGVEQPPAPTTDGTTAAQYRGLR